MIGKRISTSRLTAWLMLLAVFSETPSWAQSPIDATKITCEQLTSARAASPRTIVAWMFGYMSGKQGSAIIDSIALRNRVRDLEKYCYQEKNLKVPAMQAIEELSKAKK